MYEFSKANSSAFPNYGAGEAGITVREYFASVALQGLLAAEAAGGSDGGVAAISSTTLVRDPEVWAKCAVQLADALIAALKE